MKIEIVKGWTNGKEEYRVYENQNWTKQFETYDEALYYKFKLEQMSEAHKVDDSGRILFKHEGGF
jgi:hypothetical protein